MPTFQKIMRAAELPDGWARDFTDPDQLVIVTISDTDQAVGIDSQHHLESGINLAAPSHADKLALRSMPPALQTQLYEAAILRAASQGGRKVSKADIITGALKCSRNG